MSNSFRVFLYSLVIVSLALVSAISVIPARADDGAPPPPVSPSAPASASVHAPADLSRVPAGTDVAIVNRSGHKVALATQEAAHIVADGDPIWCPTGVAPNPGVGLCTVTKTSFNASGDLLDSIHNETVNGTIWILSGSVSDVLPVTLDAGLGTTSTHALTINGGWNGSLAGTLNPLSPSTFNVSLIINNWTAPVTVNNVTVTSANGDGLDVTTTGSILLNNINASSNTGNGAVLDNSTGLAQPVTLTGINTFSNNGASYSGLSVGSKGAITASNVTADSNGLWGAILNNCIWNGSSCDTLTAQPITLTGTNEFNSNGGPAGLQFASRGSITVNNVTANTNGGPGMFVEGTLGGATSPQNVTITGYGTFNNNWDNGLQVDTYGTITLANITANNNGQSGTFGYGVQLNNYGSIAPPFNNVYAATPKSVTLTGTNNFNNNYLGGLNVTSLGAITLAGITANTNTGGEGAYLDNSSGTLGVTLTGTNIFSENGNRGLEVRSNGAISASNLIANSNGGRGAWLDNCQAYNDLNNVCTTTTVMPVTLTGNNQFKFDGGGLRIVSNGAITTNNVTASNGFQGSGVWFNNDTSSVGSSVTMNGTNIFNNNYDSGIYVWSNGAITLNNVTATGNGTSNIHGDGAELYNNTATSPKAVTISVSGGNPDTDMRNNYSGGLVVNSLGAISLTGLEAGGSTNGNGVTLINNYSTAVGGITIGGWGGDSSGNTGGYGWLIQSKGSITATGFYAGGNTMYGAQLDNTAGTGTVTLGTMESIWVGNNTEDGLDVYSNGAITLNNVNANGNLNGAILDNSTGTSSVTIKNTSTSSSSFNNNWFTGLIIKSKGTVTLMDVDAQNNGQFNFYTSDNGGTIDDTVGYGVTIDNSAGNGSVTIGTSRTHWCNSMSNNFQSGLVVKSSGSVTMSNMCNDGNGGYVGTFTGFNDTNDDGNGAYIDNSTAVTPKSVTVKGYNEFNGNFNTGLWIFSRGAITVSNLNANDSQGEMGARLDNTTSGSLSPQNVTLTGYGDFNNNYYTGLGIHTYGAITVNNIDSENNGVGGSFGYGTALDNGCVDLGLGCTATLAKTITVNGSNTFNNNFTGGLEATSLGAIKVNNMDANNNTGYGAFLDTRPGTSTSGITLTGYAYSNFNGDYGMQALSKGAILINVGDMWAGYNGGYGWNLDNSYSTAKSSVTLTSSHPDNSFDPSNNGGYGLLVQSRGAITVTGLDSFQNNGFGAELKNDYPGSTGSVTVTTLPTVSNYFDGNTAGDGLNIYSNGAILIGNLEASNNSGTGVVFDNTGSTSASPQNVTINGFGNFNNNGDTGLKVTSYGQITVNNIDSENNGQNNFNAVNALNPPVNTFGWGAYLDNCGFNWGTTDCTNTGTPKGITLNGTNTFRGNFQDGLWATSLGAISVKQVNSQNNGGDGAYLDNQWTGATGGITVTASSPINFNYFNNNGNEFANGWTLWTLGDGLEVYSNRAVTLNNIQADGNNSDGALVDTAGHEGAYAAQNVTLSGRNVFLNNGGDGLYVAADGNITINNLTANGNSGSDGAYLDNCLGISCTGHGNITLTGANTFNGNSSGYGLYTDSHGNISISNVVADGNGMEGVYGGADGTILVSCGSMTNNVSYGWEFGSPSTVTLKAVFAFGNNSGSGNTLLDSGTLVTSSTCP